MGAVIPFKTATSMKAGKADNDNYATAHNHGATEPVAFTDYEYGEFGKIAKSLPQNVYSEENATEDTAMFFFRDRDAPKLSNVIAFVLKSRDDSGVYHYRLTVNSTYAASDLHTVSYETNNFSKIISTLNQNICSLKQTSPPPPRFGIIQGGA